MTFQIIYSSVSSTPMQLDELEDLLEQAQANNGAEAITGALVYVDGFFLQVLEGQRQPVETLMDRISRDLRHDTVRVLQAGEVAAASFSDWKMAYVSATPEQVARWAGLGGSTQLPQVWDDLHQDRSRVTQLTKGILSVLVGAQPPPGQAARV
jgi:hypothetical protein